MAWDALTNMGYSLVATAPSPATSGTTLTVTTGEGGRFTAPTQCTIGPVGVVLTPANSEIVRVTNVAGDVLTITRTSEALVGGSARTVVVGDAIFNDVSKKALTDIQTAIDNLTTSPVVQLLSRRFLD